MKNNKPAVAMLLLAATLFFAADVRAERAEGIGINIPVVGRLIGGGNTLYVTSIEVANNTGTTTQVDFYFDGNDLATGQPIAIDGSITTDGLVAVEGGTLRGHSNVHFDDFIDALVQAGRMTAETRDHGVLGSLFLVYDNFTRRGEGSASARFENAYGGGVVGVALAGQLMTTDEPQQLVATIRDTRGKSGSQVYTNLFINNTGVRPAGGGVAGAVTVELTARANSNGLPVGRSVLVTNLGPGQTRVVGELLATMQVTAANEDTILVFARVISGNAAIAGITSTIDTVTRDGSVVAMNRADF